MTETVKGSVYLKWVGSQLMVGIDSRGVPLVIGAQTDSLHKGMGLKASDLLLLAAAACATYDIVMILGKQRQPLQSLEVICTGEQESEPPYKFLHIHLHYIIKGGIDIQKLERAIQLSEEKYCSVTNTLKPSVEITSDYEILP